MSANRRLQVLRQKLQDEIKSRKLEVEKLYREEIGKSRVSWYTLMELGEYAESNKEDTNANTAYKLLLTRHNHNIATSKSVSAIVPESSTIKHLAATEYTLKSPKVFSYSNFQKDIPDLKESMKAKLAEKINWADEADEYSPEETKAAISILGDLLIS